MSNKLEFNFSPTMKSPLLSWVIFLFAAIGFIPIELSAENSAVPDRRAWVVMTSIPNKFTETTRVFSGEDSVEIPKNKRAISSALAIHKDGIISVAKVVDGLSPGEVWLKIPIAENIQQALIVLIPEVNKDGDLEIKSKVWDLSLFGTGDWLFLNLTASEIRVTEDSKALEISPNSGALSKGPSLKQSKTVAISYDYREKDSENWSSLSASSVVRDPNRREICIFMIDSELETMGYHALSFTVK